MSQKTLTEIRDEKLNLYSYEMSICNKLFYAGWNCAKAEVIKRAQVLVDALDASCFCGYHGVDVCGRCVAIKKWKESLR